MSGFVAPSGKSSRLDVEILPAGNHVGTLYGIADIGTHETSYGPKNEVVLAFEFPQQLRQFYQDGEMQPVNIYEKMNFSMDERAGLRKNYVQPMLGRTLTDAEARTFDMSVLLGKNFSIRIVHNTSTNGQVYANIASIEPLNDQNKLMYGLQEASVPMVNKPYIWHKSQGYMHENFANLPKWIRDKNISSNEGVQHKAQGGTFLEPPKGENQASGVSSTAPVGGALATRVLESVPGAAYTIEQLKAANYTEQQMIDAGYAKWSEPVAPPAPVSAVPPPAAPQVSAPAPVAPPSTPAPPAAPAPPQAPPAILVDGKPIVAKVPGTDLQTFIDAGWLPKQLVEHGHAVFQ